MTIDNSQEANDKDAAYDTDDEVGFEDEQFNLGSENWTTAHPPSPHKKLPYSTN